MHRTHRGIIGVIASLSCTAALMAVPTAARAAALTDTQRAQLAVAYLAQAQKPNGSIVAFSAIGSTADAVVAFVAAGEGSTHVSLALKYLSGRVSAGKVNTLGLRAKVVLAVSAAGRDPRHFGGTDLLRKITKTLGSDGHFGTSAVFDDSLALLAVESAGVAPGLNAASWLLAAQCPDGGWAYDKPYDPSTDDAHCFDGTGTDFFTSDSNTTSYVVQGLAAMGSTGWAADPFAFFNTVRDPAHGGWSYSASFLATDANSTGLVLQAYAAMGRVTPHGAIASLRALQYPACGAFAYSWNGAVKGDPDVGATIGAVPGLLLKPFPVHGPVTATLPVIGPCA
jgi:hypothetical protein